MKCGDVGFPTKLSNAPIGQQVGPPTHIRRLLGHVHQHVAERDSIEQAIAPQCHGVASRGDGGLQWNPRRQLAIAPELGNLSGGRYTAEIVPFDRAGIRAQEALTLVQLGAVPFATVQVSGGVKDPELSAPDLSGLNPDMASMRRSKN